MATTAASPAHSTPTLAHHPWNLLSGFSLKWIAIITMLIDHTAATLVWSYYLDLRQSFSPDAALWYDIYIWMRRIGRMAFPLFCFVLVEGFVHTRSRPKYALRTMLIDHTAATLVWSYYLDLRQSFSPDAALWYDIYIWMRRIGRMAFPLFCFVLVEGFVHTRSRSKYALRLLAFGIVAEVPYDYALHTSISWTSELNIMFTLLLAFCALWLADVVGSKLKLPWWGTSLLTVATVAGAAWLANGPLDVSYHAYGIILIGALYLARNHRFVQFLLGCAATVWYCENHNSWLQMYAAAGLACIALYNGALYLARNHRFVQFLLGCAATVWYCENHNSWLQMYAAAGLACIALYNGQRGRGMKWFFYLFYPVHLAVLGLLNAVLF